MKITIGQYYPSESIIHKLDPRLKLLFLLFFIIGLFFVKNIFGYILSAIVLFSIIKISKVPFLFIIRGLKGFLIIIIFTLILNMFFIKTGKTLFEMSFFKITIDGVWFSFQMICRLAFLTIIL